jgi:peroxiredoxin
MRILRVGAVLLALGLLTATGLEAKKKLLGEGEGVLKTIDLAGLPDFAFPAELTEEERGYLGLSKPGAFSLSDVEADLVIVEFLNVYCFACVQQAPIMNDIHRLLEEREELRDRVRFIGIAVGNGPAEIAAFKQRLDVPYPILADSDFHALDAIGNPGGTPFLVFYPRGEGLGRPRAHLGLWRDPGSFIAAIEEILAPGGDIGAAEPEFKMTTWRNLTPELSGDDLEALLRASAAEAGFAADRLEKVAVAGEENVYRLTDAAGKGLWAKVAGRAKVCNVCHDVFFVLLFTDEGKIVNFTPIHVTKYENVPIDEAEAAFMRERVVGRYITEPIEFDREVDAISKATMSSELIFDTIRRLRSAHETLKEAAK